MRLKSGASVSSGCRAGPPGLRIGWAPPFGFLPALALPHVGQTALELRARRDQMALMQAGSQGGRSETVRPSHFIQRTTHLPSWLARSCSPAGSTSFSNEPMDISVHGGVDKTRETQNHLVVVTDPAEDKPGSDIRLPVQLRVSLKFPSVYQNWYNQRRIPTGMGTLRGHCRQVCKGNSLPQHSLFRAAASGCLAFRRFCPLAATRSGLNVRGSR